MPSDMSAVWRVRHTFQACGMKAVVVSVAATLPMISALIIKKAFYPRKTLNSRNKSKF
jgi:hypothetical protein